jgi:3-dehydroshikimate dehydratase
MNISVCTISFRHQLISLEQLALWARSQRFQGIELWGVHAKNLGERPERGIAWLRANGLGVPMVSDYLPLRGDRHRAIDKAEVLCRLARVWSAGKVRTFAGDAASSSVSPDERASWVARLREFCDVAAAHGIFLVVETHPNTLADTPESTLRLLAEVSHPALRLNFDVIHVWESGADPLRFFREVESHVAHVHLKNVSAREALTIFAPANVYAPAGDRAGMVPLFEGAYDFERFLRALMNEYPARWRELDASLEWFGPDAVSTLSSDIFALLRLETEAALRTSNECRATLS